MKHRFAIGEAVGRKGVEDYKGRVVGIASNMMEFINILPYRVESRNVDFTYTVMCLCCREAKRLNESELEKVEE